MSTKELEQEIRDEIMAAYKDRLGTGCKRNRCKDWRTLKKGDKLSYFSSAFDGETSFEGVVSDVDHQRAIILADGMHLWCDDDTMEDYYYA